VPAIQLVRAAGEHSQAPRARSSSRSSHSDSTLRSCVVSAAPAFDALQVRPYDVFAD